MGGKPLGYNLGGAWAADSVESYGKLVIGGCFDFCNDIGVMLCSVSQCYTSRWDVQASHNQRSHPLP